MIENYLNKYNKRNIYYLVNFVNRAFGFVNGKMNNKIHLKNKCDFYGMII